MIDAPLKGKTPHRSQSGLKILGVAMVVSFALISATLLALGGAAMAAMGGELDPMSPLPSEITQWETAQLQFKMGASALTGVAVGALIYGVARPRRWARAALWVTAGCAVPFIVYVVAWVTHM